MLFIYLYSLYSFRAYLFILLYARMNYFYYILDMQTKQTSAFNSFIIIREVI